jgi:hypothetical protein
VHPLETSAGRGHGCGTSGGPDDEVGAPPEVDAGGDGPDAITQDSSGCCASIAGLRQAAVQRRFAGPLDVIEEIAERRLDNSALVL